MEEATAEQKRKRNMDNAETQEAERRAKNRKDGTHEAQEGQPDLQAKEKEGAKPSDKTAVPAKEGKATQKRKLCEYTCPHCSESGTSTVRRRRRPSGRGLPLPPRLLRPPTVVLPTGSPLGLPPARVSTPGLLCRFGPCLRPPRVVVRLVTRMRMPNA